MFGQIDLYDIGLWTNRLVKFIFAFIANPDYNGTFDGISILGEGHFPGDTIVLFDFGHCITDALAILLNVSCNLATRLDGRLHEAQGRKNLKIETEKTARLIMGKSL